MSNLKFVETHNLVVFLEKPKESDGFEGIIDFLNASSIKYTLTVNPTIYTSCIKQFWATAKAKTVNGEVQIQALVDGEKVIVTKTSVRRALQLKDAEVFLDKQVEGMTKHKEIYVTPFHSKKVFANMKREGKGFSGRVTPLFQTMMVQAPEEVGEGSKIPTDTQHTPTIIQPSISQPQKKQPRRKQRKDTEVLQPSGSSKPITDEAANEEHVPTHSNDPLLSGEDTLKLNELMELCTNLSQRKDASKHGRKIADLDADAEVTLVDDAQGRNDDDLMFDTRVFDEQEVEVEKVVSTAEVTTASATTTVDELTLAQTLIEIKAAKPKAVTTAATITTIVSRPKARGVIVQDPNYEFAQRLQAEEQRELTIEERSKLFVELMDKRKKHFTKLRAKEIRRKPPTKAQKRNQMYSFVPMDTKVVEGSKRQAEGSKKRTREELESDNSKKQKIDKNVEDEVDDEAEMKKHMEIVPDDEVEIDAIPLATKSPIIVDWKIIKEGKMGYFQIIRADVSSRRYSSMIRMLQNIDREDLEKL
ncbi:hypothetical protein Tco_1447281 [Tanacetum coccineum]